MLPVILTSSLTAGDDDIVAVDQTPGAAGNLTLTNASGVSVASAEMARQILITTASDESGKTLTIYGTNATGNPISETVAGPNATTGTTVNYFRSVTRVAVSAAFTGNVKVGTNGVGASRVIIPDHWRNPFHIGIGCVVSGTINYTVQHTFDEVGDSTNLTWFDHASITGQTANRDSNYSYAVLGIRVKINSGTGSVKTTLAQSG